jgi:hypothetical protein
MGRCRFGIKLSRFFHVRFFDQRVKGDEMSATEKWGNLKFPLTVLFDSNDVLSAIELKDLKAKDKKHRLNPVDVAQPGFKAAEYGMSDDEAHHGLHIRDAAGTTLRGIDADEAAYEAVGLGSYFRYTRGPGLRSGVPFGKPPR